MTIAWSHQRTRDLVVVCGKCHAGVGDPCQNLRNPMRVAAYTHSLRMKAAGKHWAERGADVNVTINERSQRREEIRSWMLPRLAGCTRGFTFRSKREAEAAVRRLSTCRAHRGAHHFAVIGDGQSIACSEAGWNCLRDAGLLS